MKQFCRRAFAAVAGSFSAQYFKKIQLSHRPGNSSCTADPLGQLIGYALVAILTTWAVSAQETGLNSLNQNVLSILKPAVPIMGWRHIINSSHLYPMQMFMVILGWLCAWINTM